ncbi:SRPBCC domain-containing protein [Cognatiyoonia sp. IB215446]|uniref:SRPBCC family protein n=1 Tax=Cognatiyoonia sp. IB215446 TaxID=3097355 RepID=UPI002A0DCFB7|nr:SRPBCC domain-containing protein [Cognatiyoonia sp. IB215446]MDX8348521.1 SRPBCC domain-containing protein [Cognatiyoonia sp. IB215446]
MTDLTMTVEHTINASQKDVFDAWLDPEMLKRFMTPGPDMTVPHAQTDAKVGGGFAITMKAGDTEIPHHGAYKEISPHDRLVFTWYGPSPAEDSTVTLTFKTVAGGTLVTLRHDRFVNEESRDNHKIGWTGILAALAAATAG